MALKLIASVPARLGAGLGVPDAIDAAHDSAVEGDDATALDEL